MLNNLKDFAWLIGQWEGIQGQGIYYEEWSVTNDSELAGKAYIILKGEIKNVETLRIHSDNQFTFYTADVRHNPAPVSFRLTSDNENKFIFENPQHDFPQKITYERKDDVSLIAIVEAVKDGQVKMFEYNLRRC